MPRLEVPIILEGAHSTGKSSLGVRLARDLGVPYHREIARDVLEKWGVSARHEGLDDWQRAQLQREILEAKQQQLKDNPGPCVIDRGVPSVYAYTLAALHDTSDPFALEFLAEARHASLRGSKRGLYLLLSPNVELVDDGVRDTRTETQHLIHHLIDGIMAEGEYTYFRVRSSEWEARYREARQLIDRYQRLDALTKPVYMVN